MLVVQLVRADGSGFWFLVSGFGFGLIVRARSRKKENRKERKKSEDRLAYPLLGRYNTFRDDSFSILSLL
jgi:hypothetical protein